MFTLETSRLLVRPWTPAERPVFAALTSDVEVLRYINGGVVYGDLEIDEFYERQERLLARLGVCMGAVVEKSSGAIVGLSGVQQLGDRDDLEIGWVFARDAWGKGYATEAGRAAAEYVLKTLERPRVVAIINPDNAASKRVAERLGMTYDRRYTGAELGHRKPELVVDLFYRNR